MVFLAINTKAILGVALVALTVVGGCGARLAGREETKVGSITGVVAAVGTDLMPVSSAGWQVSINGKQLLGSVTATGTYVIADVPPGTYTVTLRIPEREDVMPACQTTGCAFTGVNVLPSTATMHVDFDVSFIPAPPF